MPQNHATLAVTSVDLVRGPGSWLVTQQIGEGKTGGNLWLLKQDLLNTVKNNYGNNLNLINKKIILS